jgi:hypothetical protein
MICVAYRRPHIIDCCEIVSLFDARIEIRLPVRPLNSACVLILSLSANKAGKKEENNRARCALFSPSLAFVAPLLRTEFEVNNASSIALKNSENSNNRHAHTYTDTPTARATGPMCRHRQLKYIELPWQSNSRHGRFPHFQSFHRCLAPARATSWDEH